MPRHEQVSPQEDLASFYAGGDPTAGGPGGERPATPPPLPSAPLPVTPLPAAPLPAAPLPTAPPPLPTSAPPMAAPPPALAAPAPIMNSSGPEPAFAAIVSFILPGAGQLWAGQTLKGVALLVVAFFTLSGCGLLSVLAAIDAYLIAQRKRRGETVGDWQMF